MHLKGVAVFHKSTILLHLNALMVVSLCGLGAFVNPFQLSLSPETAFAESTGSLYPLLVCLLDVCMVTLSVSEQVMQSPEAVSIS